MTVRLEWHDVGGGVLEAVAPKARYLCMTWHDGKILVKFVPSDQELDAVDAWNEAKDVAQAHFDNLWAGMTDFQ